LVVFLVVGVVCVCWGWGVGGGWVCGEGGEEGENSF